jgi:hypothetical protein
MRGDQKVNYSIKCSTSDLFFIKTNAAQAMNNRKLNKFGGRLAAFGVVHLSHGPTRSTCHCTLDHCWECCLYGHRRSEKWWFQCLVIFFIASDTRTMFPSVGYTFKREFSSYYRSLQHDRPQEFVTSQVMKVSIFWQRKSCFNNYTYVDHQNCAFWGQFFEAK